MASVEEHKILRVAYVIFFYFIYGLTDFLLLLIAITQTLLNLFNGGPNQSLQAFGASLGLYVKQIAEYVSHAHDEKPFPFSDWPNAE